MAEQEIKEQEMPGLYMLVDISSLEGISFLKRAPMKQILLWAKIYGMQGKPTKRLDIISDLETLQYLFWNTTNTPPIDDRDILVIQCEELANSLPVDLTTEEELKSQIPADVLKSASQKRKEEEITMGQGSSTEGALEKGAKKSAKAPKAAKAPKEPKAPKPPVDRSTSNKAVIFTAFVGGQTDVAELAKLAKGAVKEGTIKSWIGSWYRGDNLPAIATEAQTATLKAQGEVVAKAKAEAKAKEKAEVEAKAKAIEDAAAAKA